VTRIPDDPATRQGNGRICSMFAVDITGYTRPDRDGDIRLHLRKVIYELLQEAFGSSGLPWDGCDYSDRGDGGLIIVPSSLPAANLIGAVPGQLLGLIRRHNHVSADAAQIQLRAAVHIGPVYRDRQGVAGDDVTLVFRMLQARPLRRELADSGAELALMISPYVYETLFRPDPDLGNRGTFRPVRTCVKRMRIRAWLHVPM
jgi:hypothetical protein